MPKYYIVRKKFYKCVKNVYFTDLWSAITYFNNSFCDWEPDPVLVSADSIPDKIPGQGEVCLSDDGFYFVYYTNK